MGKMTGKTDSSQPTTAQTVYKATLGTKDSAGSEKARPSRAPHRGAILHLCLDLETEDPAREVVDFSILSHRAGWPSIIASAGGVLATEAERAAVQHRKIAFNRRPGLVNDWRNRYRLDTIIQRDRPIVIHAHGADVLRYAAQACRTHQVPLVVDILHPMADNPVTRKLMAQTLDVSSVFRVPSEFMGHHLHDVWNVPMERIYHIPSGLNLQWFSTGYVTPERLSALSKLWRLPEQGSIILVPLPLMTGMGHDVFLEAMASLKNDHVFAVLMGRDALDASLRQNIENTITTLGLSGKVVMPESSSDWPAALWHASAVVVPNAVPRGENRLLLAAQAMGRPVIVTDIGANREMVDPDAAWVVPPNDIPALEKALRGAVGLDVNHRLGLAERARDFIAERFPQSAWFNESLTMYEDVLATAQKERRRAA